MQGIVRVNRILTAHPSDHNNCHDLQHDRNPIRALATLPVLLVVCLSSAVVGVADALSNRFEVSA
jgi:hypothetical protein